MGLWRLAFGTWKRCAVSWATGCGPACHLCLDNLAYPLGAGRSHEIILFDARWTEGGAVVTQGFVLRIKPTTHVYLPDDLFEEQYRLMRGQVAVTFPPYSQVGWVAEATPAQRRKMWESGVRQLAAIQGTPLSALDFLAGREGARSGLEQEWDKYRRYAAWVGHDSWPIVAKTFEDLRRRWRKNQPEGLVWGDARIGNMMFDDDFELVAVMDWEQPSLGGALHDLAWWIYMGEMSHGATAHRPHLAGMGTREETIALWREVSGKSTDDIEWYEDFTGLKVALLSIPTAAFKGPPAPDEAALTHSIQRLRR